LRRQWPWRARAGGDSTPQKELRQCDAVFSGRPVRQRTVTVDYRLKGQPAERRREFTFEVDGVWKGAVPRRTAVLTMMTSAECGYDFDIGVPYIVYARVAQGRLHTTICDWTKPLHNAKKDLRALGPSTAVK
jgi:hypothetical protein